MVGFPEDAWFNKEMNKERLKTEKLWLWLFAFFDATPRVGDVLFLIGVIWIFFF